MWSMIRWTICIMHVRHRKFSSFVLLLMLVSSFLLYPFLTNTKIQAWFTILAPRIGIHCIIFRPTKHFALSNLRTASDHGNPKFSGPVLSQKCKSFIYPKVFWLNALWIISNANFIFSLFIYQVRWECWVIFERFCGLKYNSTLVVPFKCGCLLIYTGEIDMYHFLSGLFCVLYTVLPDMYW